MSDSSSPLKLCSSPCPHCPCCRTFLQDFLNSCYLDSLLQTEPKVRDKMLDDISKFYKNTRARERTKHWRKILFSSYNSAPLLPWDQCQAPESQSRTLCPGSCVFTTQDFVLFTHVSLQTRYDKRELVLINSINQMTISKEQADKLCKSRVWQAVGTCQRPAPHRIRRARRSPLRAVTNQAAPRSCGCTSPAQTPPSPAPNCSFRERKTRSCPSNPAPKPSVLLGVLSSHTAQTPKGQITTLSIPSLVTQKSASHFIWKRFHCKIISGRGGGAERERERQGNKERGREKEAGRKREKIEKTEKEGRKRKEKRQQLGDFWVKALGKYLR